MANAIKTVLTYPLDGNTKDFHIPFEYLARKFIRVTLMGKDRKVLVLNQDYRFTSKTTITLNQAWGQAQGYDTLELRRYTSATERLVDFTDGSIMRAYDLNVAQVQTLHVAEEARDLTADTIGVNNEGNLDARGRRIVNVANAVSDRDAVPLGQLKAMSTGAYTSMTQAQKFRNEAEAFRNQSEASKNAAAASQNAAHTSELNAAGSNTAAGKSAQAALASQNAAKASETNAKNYEATAKAHIAQTAENASKALNEANRAKAEADKLGNMNQLATAVAATAGNDVRWKGIQTSDHKFHVTSDDGAQAYVNQMGTGAAYSQALPGKQDKGLYYPIVKQYGSRTSGKTSAFSMGMTSQQTDDFHFGSMHLISSDGKSVTWQYKPNGDFVAPQGAITAGGIVSGKGLSADTGGVVAQGPLVTKQPHAGVILDNPSATNASYILGRTGGANEWYVGKGGAGNEIYLQSYKLGTAVMLTADHVAVTKDLHVGTQGAKLVANGNVSGPIWGGDLVTWIRNNVTCKGAYSASIGEQLVWKGSAGHGVTMHLNADIRWRQVYIVISGYRFSYRFGGDGNYFMYGWGGWIKLTLSGGGRALRNNEDNQSVPTAIYMEK